jgi:hypothetical protein
METAPPPESKNEPQITRINANYRLEGKILKAAIEVNTSPPPTAQTRQALAGIR